MRRHFVIPDTQVKPGVPLDHLEWIGAAIAEYEPDVVVCLGDWADMESLSSYAKRREAEGKRYAHDTAVAEEAMRVLFSAVSENAKTRAKRAWKARCRWVLTLGNHEYRIERAIDENPQLEGFMSMADLGYEKWGWEVYPFLDLVEIDGVTYCHYFQNPVGRPHSAMIETRIRNIGFSFVQGHQQGLRVGSVPRNNGVVHRGVSAGSCLAPHHRVLTADLQYVPLGDLVVGDRVVSFDETPTFGRCRRYKTGTVTALKRDFAECVEVTLETGRVFTATTDHLWLTRIGGPSAVLNGGSYKWRRTTGMRAGTRLPRLFEEWSTLNTRDAGYLAGVYDGEGCLYARPTGGAGGAVMALSLAQRENVVLRECIRILNELLGLDGLTHTNQRGVAALRIRGGARMAASVLGAIRPARLLEKFEPRLLGSLAAPTNDRVASIRPVGIREIVRIEIDEKTMIVEGYPHHNCYIHDEGYMAQANAGHWRGCVVLNDVHGGTFDLMELSLDYLCRKYGGRGEHVWRFMKREYPALYRTSSWLKLEELRRR